MTAPPLDARTTDGDALLAAVIAAPDDDAPRLVYADWLDERGGDGPCPEPGCGNPARGWNGFYQCRTCKGRGVVSNGFAERAEFIRVQCELARDPERAECRCAACQDPSGRQTVCFLRRRERELMIGPAFDWFKLDGLATFSDTVKGTFGGWCLKRSGEPGVDIRAVVRRGWVAEIRLTCGAFVGERCERCGGDRRLTFPNCQRWDGVGNPDMVECPDCRGMGARTPGLAALAGRQPVTAVVLTGKEPEHVVRGPGFDEWTWFVGDALSITSSAHLPNAIWRHMNRTWHPSRDAAIAALSAACVAYLRASSRDRARSAAQNPA